MNLDLFQNSVNIKNHERVAYGTNTSLLKNFASAYEANLITTLDKIIVAAPFQHMLTRGGFKMSVAMSSCGDWGWISDRKGYRYSAINPLTNEPWPSMPHVFLQLASSAASAAGFANFVADSCLINRYEIGARMALHQDLDEKDFNQPIVSVSLGIPAIFLMGGVERTDATQRILLQHNDVMVWGGEDRLRFHGVMPIKNAQHALLHQTRINLTFRRAN